MHLNTVSKPALDRKHDGHRSLKQKRYTQHAGQCSNTAVAFIEMRKTDCFGVTRLVPYVPNSP